MTDVLRPRAGIGLGPRPSVGGTDRPRRAAGDGRPRGRGLPAGVRTSPADRSTSRSSSGSRPAPMPSPWPGSPRSSRPASRQLVANSDPAAEMLDLLQEHHDRLDARLAAAGATTTRQRRPTRRSPTGSAPWRPGWATSPSGVSKVQSGAAWAPSTWSAPQREQPGGPVERLDGPCHDLRLGKPAPELRRVGGPVERPRWTPWSIASNVAPWARRCGSPSSTRRAPLTGRPRPAPRPGPPPRRLRGRSSRTSSRPPSRRCPGSATRATSRPSTAPPGRGGRSPSTAGLILALSASDRAGRITEGRFDARVLTDLERLGYPGRGPGPGRRRRPTRRPPTDPDRTGTTGAGCAWIRAAARSRSRCRSTPAGSARGSVSAGRGGPSSGAASSRPAPAPCSRRAAIWWPAGRRRTLGPWLVGVEDPLGRQEHLAVIEVERGAVTTSSVAIHRWATADGRTVHHLIDPRTGEPGGDGLLAVTVAGPDPAWSESGASPVPGRCAGDRRPRPGPRPGRLVGPRGRRSRDDAGGSGPDHLGDGED